MTEDTALSIIDWIRGITMAVIGGVIVFCLVCATNAKREKPDVAEREANAIVLVNPEAVTAQWQYQQLRMEKCAWCGRTVDMNRHHVIPQAANPALRDVRENLVVLCRDCHFVLGHRCNWKQYNPDVLYICTRYTNCVKSAETRKTVEGEKTPVVLPPPVVVTNIDTTPILHVTNDVPPAQRDALERILKWNNGQIRPSEVR